MDKKEIGKWGNSLSVRLPRRMTEQLGWNEGDQVDMEIFRKSLVLKKDDSDTSVDILKTIAACIDYIVYNREYNDFDEDTERQLLRIINFGTAALLDEDSVQTSEDACLKMAQVSINFVLDRYGPKKTD